MRIVTGFALKSCVWLCFILLVGCASLPVSDEYPSSSFLVADPDTALGRMVVASHGDMSGVRVLDGGSDAFIERAALIEAAERSIDAQYYIWNSDITGRYLALRLLAAADRGVRVRLLLDDINVAGRDAVLAGLDQHPNVELRVYNPFAERGGARKLFDFLYDFSRLNRRMHNKSFTVDGAVSIVGGRNIGDEYFDAHKELNFRDRDVVAIGPVVSQVGSMFDLFWNSTLSIPASALTENRQPLPPAAVRQQAERLAADTLRGLQFELPADKTAALATLNDSRARMVWAPARLVHDEPPQLDAVDQTDRAQPTAAALGELARTAQHDVLIESAYLVMDEPSLQVIADIHARGVAVRVLTNSLASNDVTANHAAYARRRVPILRSGISLHELRPDADYCSRVITRGGGCSAHRIIGLHSKTFVFDRRTVAIGSLNLNMRSAYLNAETTMIIESPQLAEEVAAAIELGTRQENSWEVVLDDGQPLWQTQRSGTQVTTRKEPDSSWWRRVKSGLISRLPLEKYL